MRFDGTSRLDLEPQPPTGMRALVACEPELARRTAARPISLGLGLPEAGGGWAIQFLLALEAGDGERFPFNLYLDPSAVETWAVLRLLRDQEAIEVDLLDRDGGARLATRALEVPLAFRERIEAVHDATAGKRPTPEQWPRTMAALRRR